MKNLLSKIVALFLAILVLFSSSFIIIDEHYCEGKLVHFSIFGKADVCEMDMLSCAMESQNTSLSKSDCCINSKDFKSGTIFEKTEEVKIEFQSLSLSIIPNINWLYQNLYVDLTNNNSYFKNYIPPLITKNILALVQCFRI